MLAFLSLFAHTWSVCQSVLGWGRLSLSHVSTRIVTAPRHRLQMIVVSEGCPLQCCKGCVSHHVLSMTLPEVGIVIRCYTMIQHCRLHTKDTKRNSIRKSQTFIHNTRININMNFKFNFVLRNLPYEDFDVTTKFSHA